MDWLIEHHLLWDFLEGPDFAVLVQVAQRYRNVSRELRYVQRASYQAMLRIGIGRIPRLRGLTYTTNEIIEAIQGNVVAHRLLRLHTENIIATALRGVPLLEYLDVSKNSFTNFGMAPVVPPLIHLRELRLSFVDMEEGCLATILSWCPNLESLDLSRSLPSFTVIPAGALAGCRLLKKLTVRAMDSVAGLHDALLQVPELEELDLMYALWDEPLCILPLPNLRRLNLYGATRLFEYQETASNLRLTLQSCPNIEYLDVGYSEMPAAAVEMIEDSLGSLSTLILHGNPLGDETIPTREGLTIEY